MILLVNQNTNIFAVNPFYSLLQNALLQMNTLSHSRLHFEGLTTRKQTNSRSLYHFHRRTIFAKNVCIRISNACIGEGMLILQSSAYRKNR